MTNPSRRYWGAKNVPKAMPKSILSKQIGRQITCRPYDWLGVRFWSYFEQVPTSTL